MGERWRRFVERHIVADAPSDRIEPLNASLLEQTADSLDHDDALRIVRRLKLRFPCMSHERCFCPEWHQEVFDD